MTLHTGDPLGIADTSVAVACLLQDHEANVACRRAVIHHRCALAGHAVFETYSVLTRLPPGHRLSPSTVGRLLEHDFPVRVWPTGAELEALLHDIVAAEISGGAVFDSLVAAAARAADLPLLTRDQRAMSTYRRMGIRVLVVGAPGAS